VSQRDPVVSSLRRFYCTMQQRNPMHATYPDQYLTSRTKLRQPPCNMFWSITVNAWIVQQPDSISTIDVCTMSNRVILNKQPHGDAIIVISIKQKTMTN